MHTTIIAPHNTESAKLASVIAEMQVLGAPTIKAVDCGDYWLALEGSHRIAAAQQLGLIPTIDAYSYSDTVEHDCEDVRSNLVADLADYLSPGPDSVAYQFNDGLAEI
ncbi:MAG: hypothetical protein ACKO0Z_19050 [Betaproteobacteria bacterium]